MQNFILHTPTKILFGKDQIAELGQQIPADARILITYGGGSVKKTAFWIRCTPRCRGAASASSAALSRTRPLKR
ncbi:hypothetical protein GGER_45590 [Serratia rubidaea]